MLPIMNILRQNTFRLQIPSAILSREIPSRSSSTGNDNTILKSVFISQSDDVYSNLALEDWIYTNWHFDLRSILFLWRNSPCVVMGRHQNPYLEANMCYLNSANVPVVRRNSGGGTVYHDEGNLNCTFFSSRERYSRPENLEVICKALEKLNIETKINPKHDIVDENDLKFQLSGTAAKLGRLSAYHHCTVLVSADVSQMKLALQGQKNVKTNATKSVPSSVNTLRNIKDDINVEQVLSNISKSYLTNNRYDKMKLSNGGVTLVNPTEDWFPGLNEHVDKLKSWDWLYGMTPDFTVSHKIQVVTKTDLIPVTVQVHHGIIKDVTVESSVPDIEESIKSAFVGLQYSPDIFVHSEMAFQKRKSLNTSV